MPPKPDTGSTSLNKLVDKRANIFSIVSGIWNKVQIYDISNLFEFQAYQEKIPVYETKFQNIQEEIMELNYSLPLEERVETAPSELAFTDAVTHIRGLFLSLKRQEISSNNSPISSYNLIHCYCFQKLTVALFPEKVLNGLNFFNCTTH
ncbi:hypothetical protein HHI36_014745 [Cryptolaemus montrouzieri]|uniref:Uncharacterized protein n=1 Tax=Cryptolaemus montrouzieri TaxID=559131 RepID=A0ABD2N3H4_9CUCU